MKVLTALQTASVLLGLVFQMPSCMANEDAPLEVFAAGSLREPFTQIAKQFEVQSNVRIKLSFGASGLLRERIEKGEAAQVFASADTEHPSQLAQSGTWANPQVFVRNQMCALAQAHLKISSDQLLASMLDPNIRLGTSTPKVDPSGDYAFALFAKAEAIESGAKKLLESKALLITGGPQSELPPAGRNAYAWLLDENKADLILTYCTNATLAKKERPALQIIAVPQALQVYAAYGVTLKTQHPPRALKFTQYLLSPEAQSIFSQFGFGSP